MIEGCITLCRFAEIDRCCSLDQTVRFAYVISLRAERKQMHVLCKLKALPTQELTQRATEYSLWGSMFLAWTVYTYLLPFPPSLITLPFICRSRCAAMVDVCGEGIINLIVNFEIVTIL